METALVQHQPVHENISSESTPSHDLGTLLVNEIKKHENGMTRRDLCAFFSLPRTTIYDALRLYMTAKIVKKVTRKPEEKRRGRNDVYFIFSENEKE